MSEPYVWVTGASSGIGYELVNAFAAKGHSVLATARRTGRLEELKIKYPEGRIFVDFCDVTSYDSIKKCVTSFTENTDRSIDCLINNAGITSFTPAAKDSRKTVEDIINTNLLGAIHCINAVIPAMIERKHGTIINILSVVTKKIFSKSSAYSASKAGLKAYTDVLREEVRRYGVKVMNILPGATKTPIWGSDMLESSASRMMHPADIAHLILDLYTGQTSYVAEEITLRPPGGDL